MDRQQWRYAQHIGQWFNRLLMEREIRDKNDRGITVSMGFNGLSHKQELFSKLVAVDGLNISDAYREAYDTKTNKQNSLYNQASMLASNPKVAQRIEAMKADISDKLASEVVWDKARIVSELGINVDLGRETKQLAASNQALNLIGKAVGSVFEPDSVAVTGSVSVIHGLSNEVLDQLASMVQEPESLASEASTIEASYKLLDTEPE